MAIVLAKDGCIGEKLEDLVVKICHFVINEMDFWEFVVTSQEKRKYMSEGGENSEVHLSLR